MLIGDSVAGDRGDGGYFYRLDAGADLHPSRVGTAAWASVLHQEDKQEGLC